MRHCSAHLQLRCPQSRDDVRKRWPRRRVSAATDRCCSSFVQQPRRPARVPCPPTLVPPFALRRVSSAFALARNRLDVLWAEEPGMGVCPRGCCWPRSGRFQPPPTDLVQAEGGTDLPPTPYFSALDPRSSQHPHPLVWFKFTLWVVAARRSAGLSAGMRLGLRRIGGNSTTTASASGNSTTVPTDCPSFTCATSGA